MDCQQVEASNIIVPRPPVSIHVMVVDDDATSLAVVSSLLKSLNYEVASFNDPIRALNTLRAGKQSFDLIMTALYMPKMDGFELTRRVNDEFKLPVIMISTDDRESVMFRAIQEGVELYLLKPFSPNHLKNIWQFVITTKSRSIPDPNLIIDETRSHGVEFRAAVKAHSISSSNEVMPERKKKKDSKWKVGNQEKANDEMELTPTKKKAKVVWTDFLQYRFLHAVHYIGLDRAVPKKILEVMNVPGLTRENVASHLQKYRIFLRKVAERCMISCGKTPEEIIWSKFLSRHASLVLEKIEQKRAFHLNSSQNPNNPPFSNHQSSNPNNGDRRRFTNGQLSFAKNLPTYGLGHTASFVNHSVGPLPVNQNNAQVFNFSVTQFQNLTLFEDSYLGSCFPSNNNYYPGFSVDVDGAFSEAQKGVSNGFDGSYVGFDALGVENFQRDEFGQYGIGFGGDNNSYNLGLMCNNGVNFGGDSQNTVRHSSHALNNKEGVQEDSGFFASLYPLESFVDNSIPNQQQGSGDFMKDQSHQLHNMYSADEESSTTDPFSIDDQVLDEFLTSLLRNDNNSA